MSGETVVVTGAAGYVGTYVVKELLSRGYRVRATVREAGDRKKTAHLRAMGNEEQLELHSADLEVAGSFEQAMAGARYVVHSASVVLLNAKDPQREIVDVAVTGTRNVIQTAIAAGSVKRIVMTSSISAVVSNDRDQRYIFSEGDWNDAATVKSDPYGVSKVESERTARRLVDGKGVEFVAICPGLVLGPVLSDAHLRTSPAVLYEVMSGKFPAIPNFFFQVVDVRDVAIAHVAAMEREKPSSRYVCTASAMGLRQMAEIARRTCPRAKISRWPMPGPAMYAVAAFDKRLSFSFLERNLNSVPTFDNSRIKKELGLNFRPVEVSVGDTARSMEEGGFLA